jgi:hypothetical protein
VQTQISADQILWNKYDDKRKEFGNYNYKIKFEFALKLNLKGTIKRVSANFKIQSTQLFSKKLQKILTLKIN